MTQTLETYQTPNVETDNLELMTTPFPTDFHPKTERLRQVIAQLERHSIGWLDILTAMANIAAEGDTDEHEQIAQVLESRVLVLKQNRRVRRDL